MKHGLALDIDETLSASNIFWFESLSRLFGNPENLFPLEIAEKYRYTDHVPYWQSDEAIAWLDSARKSNEIHVNMPLIENAHNIVQKINEIIPIVAYTTARPHAVIEGTKN